MLNTVLSMAIMAIYSMVIALIVIVGIQDGNPGTIVVAVAGGFGALFGFIGAHIYR